MRALAHCSSVRYAVIQARHKKGRSDRFVIAYQDEKCLQDLIAVPSIFGPGSESREETIAKLEGQTSDAAPSKEEPRFSTVFHATRENRDLERRRDKQTRPQGPAIAA
jgi:hypothetical protein